MLHLKLEPKLLGEKIDRLPLQCSPRPPTAGLGIRGGQHPPQVVYVAGTLIGQSLGCSAQDTLLRELGFQCRKLHLIFARQSSVLCGQFYHASTFGIGHPYKARAVNAGKLCPVNFPVPLAILATRNFAAFQGFLQGRARNFKMLYRLA